MNNWPVPVEVSSCGTKAAGCQSNTCECPVADARGQLICLDHDLGSNRVRNGEAFDPGTGRDVADYLATREPACAVIIHTTNHLADPGMAMVLEDSGWEQQRVVPYNDRQWIREVWIKAVSELLTAE